MTSSTKLTLADKEAMLQATVALPTAEDWSLALDDDDPQVPKIVDELNAHLVAVLNRYKGNVVVRGQLYTDVFGPLDALDEKYAAGITDSEGQVTVARFFALNLDLALYGFMRGPGPDAAD